MTGLSSTLPAFFIYFIKPYKKLLSILCLCSLFRACAMSGAPFLLKLIIDSATDYQGEPNEIFAILWIPLLLYILLFELINWSYIGTHYIILKTMPFIRADVRNGTLEYLQKHSNNFFNNNLSGSLGNKILDIGQSFIKILETALVRFLHYIGGFIISIIVVFTVSPLFAFIIAGWTIIVLGGTYLLSGRAIDYANIFSKSRSKFMGGVIDSVANIAQVKNFANEKYEMQYIEPLQQDFIKKNQDLNWFMLKLSWFQGTILTIFIAIIMPLLISSYAHGEISVGDFAFITTLIISMIYGLFAIADEMITLFQEIGTCKQALELITTPHEIIDHPQAKNITQFNGDIRFNNVNFAYDAGMPIFSNLNISIKQGEKIGLVGYSGGGKTTFINLLLRNFDLNSGSIEIDGQNIAHITQESLRNNITIIPQDTILFHRSLMNNIRYGDLQASDEQVVAASKKAHCHEFITQLKNSYDTFVGERGVKLSGGQRQRIAIARAILKQSSILIMDEATSALDSQTEEFIQENFINLTKNRTTIVIAHRLSTLNNLDRILVFDAGKVTEEGSHQQLLAKNGVYKNLWNMQAKGFIK